MTHDSSSLHRLVRSGRAGSLALTLLALSAHPLPTANADEEVPLANVTSERERPRPKPEGNGPELDSEQPSEGLPPDAQSEESADAQSATPDEKGVAADEEESGGDAEAPADEQAGSGNEPGGPDEPQSESEGEPESADDELQPSEEDLAGGAGTEIVDLTAGLLSFVERVSALLNDREAKPPPNNTYSYETGFSSGLYPEPPVYLTPTESHSAIASTDCSGWLSYALDTTAPLHRAALQSQRRLSEYNRDYGGRFLLQEARRLWSRAFIVTHFLRSDHANEVGFSPVARIEDVQRGDIVGYALGRYANPTDTSLRRTGDSGHVFIVVGTPSIVDEETENYDGNGSLSDRAAMVLAVPGLDSSSSPHFPPDSRANKQGRFELPPNPPSDTASPGGIGTGVVWFAVDGSGEVLQARIGPRRRYHDVVAGAGRMHDSIALIPQITDVDGNLLIEAFDNTPSHFGKQSYGRVPVRLTGAGGIRIAGDGAVILNGDSDFSGGVKIDSGAAIVRSPTALGTGSVEVRGGALILEHPALHDDAVLRISDTLNEGAIRLEFSGEDVVRAVELGEDTYSCGTLGSVVSEATHPHPAITGPGLIRIGDPDLPCTER